MKIKPLNWQYLDGKLIAQSPWGQYTIEKVVNSFKVTSPMGSHVTYSCVLECLEKATGWHEFDVKQLLEDEQ